MFNSQEQKFQHRFFVIRLIFSLTLLILILVLIQKTIFGHKYYNSLSESNRTRETKIIAPRGVFFDRDDRLLVSNRQAQQYGLRRHYLYSRETAHLLGYLSLPTEVNLQDYSCGAPPLTNQFVGKMGLEKYFECQLRGMAGKQIFEVNALGQKIRTLARQEPKQGQNVYLSILLELQQQADRLLQGQRGAVIASNPQNGEILLFYSSPSFNPNQLLKQPGLFNQLSADPNKPLFNRLTLGLYPPGSVIKPLLAIGALGDNVINTSTEYTDNGIYKLGNLEFGNWYYRQYGKTEGQVNVVKAIRRSNDIFFYHLGVEMGLAKINAWLKRFGLGTPNLSQYFPQATSLLPTNRWKQTTLGEPWYLGDTVNLSIGQGYLLVNPLELHQAISALANHGRQCDLTFLKNGLRHCRSLKIASVHINTVVVGMKEACQTGGTGWPFFDFKINGQKFPVACKTGTAEAGSSEASPHAWFTVFAPLPNPEIVLTVLVENGGEGSSVAAPIAKEILTQYFSRH